MEVAVAWCLPLSCHECGNNKKLTANKLSKMSLYASFQQYIHYLKKCGNNLQFTYMVF